jgi:hypothetical protein
MDNVMNRPLFQRYAKNRPATEAMYELSGIMRSSPELIETVQKFQAGGLVRAVGQNLPQAPGTAVVPGAAQMGAGPAGGPGPVPPGTFTSRANIPPMSSQNNLAQNLGRVARTAPIVGAGAVGASMLGGEPIDVTQEAGSMGLPSRPTGSLRSALRQIDEAEAAGTEMDRTQSPVQRAQAAAEALLSNPAARQRASAQLEAAAAENPELQRLRDVALSAAAEGKTDKERAEDALRAAGREVPEGTRGLVDAYKAMISQAYGVDVERENRLSGLNKALVGFTIAAGQDPSALVNIANGLASGSQMAIAREDAKQSREDRIADLAVQQAFAERNAQLRAEMGTRTGDYTPERLRQRAIEAILRDPGEFNVYDDKTGQVDPVKVQQQAGLLVDSMVASGGAAGPADVGVNVDVEGSLAAARAAIAAGRDRATIIRRLQEAGIDPGGL